MSSIKENPNRVLWISDFFPRPFKQNAGIWSIKTALAIKKTGVEVVVLSPTPWIPKGLAFSPALVGWANVPYRCEIDDLPVFYPKCPHYPNSLIRKYIYKNFPFLETEAIYKWVDNTVSDIMDEFPFQLVHANFMFPCGYIGYRIKKKYGVPLVFHERGICRLNTALENGRLREIYSKVVRNSDLVIAPSEKMAEILRRKFPCGGDITVVRDVGDIDISEEASEARPIRYQGNKIIVSVGALTERKGHEVLVKAVSRIKEKIPEVKCLIIGSGNRFDKIRQLIHDLRLSDSVELLGEIPHVEVLKIMSWCDVFVLPSWDEAFGTVNAEAMTFGKPVIGCVGEGISEVIEDGVQGFLVEKRDVEALAQAVSRILTDMPLARRMGAQSMELSRNVLNYKQISYQMINLYAKILS
jgi:teichuronic acid biosynthesis glycosyltransferase TuaC